MAPSLLVPTRHMKLKPEPLTPPSFESFGTAVSCPLPVTQQTIPLDSPPKPPLYSSQPDYTIANQFTALKYAPISPLVNKYQGPSNPLMSMFVCFPRQNIRSGVFGVKILERHPYTTQTFCPTGLAPDDQETCFLVIVAPSLSGSAVAMTSCGKGTSIQHPPDLTRIRAFIAHGGQTVTYAAGTWHAPMVVLGKCRVEFVVIQFVNGVADEDCQEVQVGEGVTVDVSKLMLAKGGPKL